MCLADALEMILTEKNDLKSSTEFVSISSRYTNITQISNCEQIIIFFAASVALWIRDTEIKTSGSSNETKHSISTHSNGKIPRIKLFSLFSSVCDRNSFWITQHLPLNYLLEMAKKTHLIQNVDLQMLSWKTKKIIIKI